MEAGPVFVIAISAWGVNKSESVLFAELGSDAVGGGVALAVLTSVPVASGATVADARNVTFAPAGMLTVVLMLPLPDATLHVAPPAPAQLHVAPVSTAGRLSITVAPIASLGPALLTVIVYVVVLPGTTVETPFVFVIPRFVTGAAIAVIAFAVLFPGAGSGVVALETVAEFTIGSGVV
jgi:hypothetical protein